MLLTAPFTVVGNGPVLGPACGGPPTIDGTFGPGEWDQADYESFTIRGDHDGDIYVMNDLNNLYICVRIFDNETYAYDAVSLFFDNDNDGVREAGDDGLIISITTAFLDRYYDGTNIQTDSQKDGAGNRGIDLAYVWTYEFAHPLCSGDTGHDFCLTSGDTVGFTLMWTDQDELGTFSDYWPASFASPGEWGDIEIAECESTPAEPVGGDVFPIDKLAMLTPYILVALAIVTATSILIKKRRN